jgi:hypothetical protein
MVSLLASLFVVLLCAASSFEGELRWPRQRVEWSVIRDEHNHHDHVCGNTMLRLQHSNDHSPNTHAARSPLPSPAPSLSLSN